MRMFFMGEVRECESMQGDESSKRKGFEVNLVTRMN
jgi:hypothetical protein